MTKPNDEKLIALRSATGVTVAANQAASHLSRD